MSELDATLHRLGGHEGVEHLILLGRDGLVVRHAVGHPGAEEAISARVPGLASACEALGAAASQGACATAVLEFAGGVTIVLALPGDLLLAVLLRPGIGFAPLLRELRRERERLVQLL